MTSLNAAGISRLLHALDAVFVPTTQVRAAAEAVAEANGLAGDW